MYLISVYFDDKSSKTLQKYIDRIAFATGNLFMSENNVPPHLTVCAFESKSTAPLVPAFENLVTHISGGVVPIVALGQFLPYVLYVSPVFNSYLQDLSIKTFDCFSQISGVLVNKFYSVGNWLPHITLAKTLSKDQLRTAFDTMQEIFHPMETTVTEISLAKTNPHHDILRFRL